MLSVAFFIIVLCAIMPNAVMTSVVAPTWCFINPVRTFARINLFTSTLLSALRYKEN
jgi:hypothetical protein